MENKRDFDNSGKVLNKNPTDAEEQFKLGSLYYFGDGVAQNYEEAFKLWLLAAKQGHVYAQHNIGICYANGQGVN